MSQASTSSSLDRYPQSQSSSTSNRQQSVSLNVDFQEQRLAQTKLVVKNAETLMTGINYLLSVYCHLTGKHLVMYEPAPSELEELSSALVLPQPPDRQLSFNPSHPHFVRQLNERLFIQLGEDLQRFLQQHCLFGHRRQVRAQTLYRAFKQYVGDKDMSEHQVFPRLMSEVIVDGVNIDDHRYSITRQQNKSGTFYQGLSLKNR